MNRAQFLQRAIESREPWDIAVVGGGATGAGIAADAASRGFRVVLLEQSDFGKGTSSRSTKLVHGGVRYLKQGNFLLVRESLKERGRLRQNAPHLVRNIEFIVPNYRWWEAPFYGLGLKFYDMLAGQHGFGASEFLSREQVLERIPTINPRSLRGGVCYRDGQFDDSRLLINLAQTAAEHGACVVNYTRVTRLTKDSDGRVTGLNFRDEESGCEYSVAARCVVNATGAFCDELRREDDSDAAPLVTPSQGAHIVLPREFLPGRTALMIPRTCDGRVLFAIPWHEHVILGTTDTPIRAASLEPRALAREVQFILDTAGRYLARRPTRDDILSVFTGVRPLVKDSEAARTAALSRDHVIQVSKSGLLTITGGKWTTYRKMAEDVVDHAIGLAKLDKRLCVTGDLRLHGFHREPEQFGALAYYGNDAEGITKLVRDRPELGEPLSRAIPICGAQIVWAARNEMARTLDDVLARRTRALFLNARAAVAMAPQAARILATELSRDESWQQRQIEEFETIAAGFSVEEQGLPSGSKLH